MNTDITLTELVEILDKLNNRIAGLEQSRLPLTLSATQSAHHLGISLHQFRAAVVAGELSPLPIEGERRFARTALDDWLEAKALKAQS